MNLQQVPQMPSLFAMLNQTVRMPTNDEMATMRAAEAQAAIERKMKVCKSCEKTKHLTEFDYRNLGAKTKNLRRKDICMACES